MAGSGCRSSPPGSVGPGGPGGLLRGGGEPGGAGDPEPPQVTEVDLRLNSDQGLAAVRLGGNRQKSPFSGALLHTGDSAVEDLAAEASLCLAPRPTGPL